MDQWWERSNIAIGKDEKEKVEDITGCIPLLLDKCVVDGKIDLSVGDLRQIYQKAVCFVQTISEYKEQKPFRWRWYDFFDAQDIVDFVRYCDYVTACFYHETIPSGWPQHIELVDHRYFYHDDNEIGGYTCGLVRDAVAGQLLQCNVLVANTGFLTLLARFIENPSVTGFIMEYAVLSAIRSNGLPAARAGIGKGMEVRELRTTSDIKTDIEQPVFYAPRKFNYKARDRIIVLTKPEKKGEKKGRKKELLVFPLQITVAPSSHSDSHEKFFEDYGEWITQLSGFNVQLQFLWITPELSDSERHPADPERRWPEHQERYIPFKDVDKGMWERYENALKKLSPEEFARRKASAKNPAKKPTTTQAATTQATTRLGGQRPAPPKAAPTKSTQTKAPQPGTTRSGKRY